MARLGLVDLPAESVRPRPSVAVEILKSIADDLLAITTDANHARGAQTDELSARLFGMVTVVSVVGPSLSLCVCH